MNVASVPEKAKDWQLKVDLGRQLQFLEDIVSHARADCPMEREDRDAHWAEKSNIHTDPKCYRQGLSLSAYLLK